MCKACIFWKLRISKILCPKVLNFFMQASLAVMFIWTKFQVKIQKYGFAANLRSYRENSLKPRYLVKNKPETRTLFTIDTAHWGLQDARNPDWKPFGIWECSLVSSFSMDETVLKLRWSSHAFNTVLLSKFFCLVLKQGWIRHAYYISWISKFFAVVETALSQPPVLYRINI